MDDSQFQEVHQLDIRLSRIDSGQSWGFRLQGGVDFATPLSIQLVQPGSISERCGLKAGDAILTINNMNSDGLAHEEAKMEIIRSGNDIDLLVQRGAVRIWKPQVTPMSDLRPAELQQTATGDYVQPIQKTSLAKQHEDPMHIGTSHNRAPQPFQGYGVPGRAPKQASANVIHAQFNSPMSLYSADNIADTYAAQTAGISDEMNRMDLNQHQLGTRMSGAHQVLESTTDVGNPGNMPSGMRSVRAPDAKPPGQQAPQKQLMKCAECTMLITGLCVKAAGQHFHEKCFKCANCGVFLKQKGYFLIEGKLYCDIHSKRAAKPPGPNMVAVPVFR